MSVVEWCAYQKMKFLRMISNTLEGKKNKNARKKMN